jgi:sugar lactone lactonase YvrE
LRGIVSLDLESLERNIVSSASVGTGTFFSSPGPIEVNSDETKAYVLDSGLTAFIEVDLASGNRSMLSFPGFVGSGNSYNSGVESIYLTEDDSLIYYVERSANRVSVLDVSTGNNSVVSNGLKGTGTNFDNPYTIMVDATETKAYVLNSDVGGNDFFLEVDFETGNRTVLSSDAVGTGDSIDGAFESVLFNSGSSILVHSLNRALYEVSISTGDRTEKVDFKTVSGSRIRNILTVSNDEQFSYSTHFGSTEVIKTNLLTGSRSVVTSNVIGSGTTIMNINAMKTNSDGSVFYASDSGSSILNSTNTNILRIDSSTGNRTVVASSGVGSGPNFNFPRGIVLTSDDSKAYFVDGNLNALFELNVSTGARTIVSQDGVAGTGPAFNNANNLVLNSAETIAYVTNISGTSVYQVDLSTGNRTVVSSGSVGTGPSLSSPVGIAIDETRNVLYVGSTSSLYTGLIQVDLSTGNRVRLFGEDEKKGPSIYNADHIKYNPTGDYVIAYDNNFEWILKGDLKLGTTSLVVK